MRKKIPKFKSLEDERKFWATHSVTEFMDELRPANVNFIRPKKKLVSLRLEEDQIASLKAFASRKGLGYLTLIRSWIVQNLQKQ